VTVAPDDVAEIRAAIRSLLADPARRAELGANGRRYVAGTPTRETVMAAFARAVEEAVAVPAPRPAG
jgi:glycosyltransferase involved in cell wall biosynthesis